MSVPTESGFCRVSCPSAARLRLADGRRNMRICGVSQEVQERTHLLCAGGFELGVGAGLGEDVDYPVLGHTGVGAGGFGKS